MTPDQHKHSEADDTIAAAKRRLVATEVVEGPKIRTKDGSLARVTEFIRNGNPQQTRWSRVEGRESTYSESYYKSLPELCSLDKLCSLAGVFSALLTSCAPLPELALLPTSCAPLPELCSLAGRHGAQVMQDD